jgi:hypothetical protein
MNIEYQKRESIRIKGIITKKEFGDFFRATEKFLGGKNVK